MAVLFHVYIKMGERDADAVCGGGGATTTKRRGKVTLLCIFLRSLECKTSFSLIFIIAGSKYALLPSSSTEICLGIFLPLIRSPVG